MDFRDENINISDKIDFFQSLSNEEKKEQYHNMNKEEKSALLSILPFQYIKRFIQIVDIQTKKEIYTQLTENQLKAIYNTLNTDEQKEMAATLEEIQIDLRKDLTTARTNIIDSTNGIKKAENRIQTSTSMIQNAKAELKTQQQQLKQSKITIKKLEQERKRNLKKVIKASKPSILDRIGIISKHRTKKLMAATDRFTQTLQNIETVNQENGQIQQKIENLQTTIQQEYQSINDRKEEINQNKQRIEQATTTIQKTEINIRQFSQTEKRVLGRKLYHKKINERNAVMVRRKTNIETKINTEEPKVVTTTPKTNTQESMNQIMNHANQLKEAGVNFYPPSVVNPSVNSSSLAEDPIMQIDTTQLIIATYSMIAFYNYLILQQKNMQQNPNLSEGYQRKLTPNSRGVVNLPLLISILLFILSLCLFLTK